MYQAVNKNKQFIIVFVSTVYRIQKTSKYIVSNVKDRSKGRFPNSGGNIETDKLTSKVILLKKYS